jgi:hypothetical protein
MMVRRAHNRQLVLLILSFRGVELAVCIGLGDELAQGESGGLPGAGLLGQKAGQLQLEQVPPVRTGRPVGVVLGDEPVDRGLRGGQVVEAARGVEQFAAQRRARSLIGN